MLAIVVITASFIVLLSVFNGFEGLVRSLYSTFYTDLCVIPASGKKMQITPSQLRQLTIVPGIKDYSLTIEEKTLLQNGDVQTIVYLKGVDDNYVNVTSVAEKVVRGSFQLGTVDQPMIVLGSGIENALAVISDRTIYPVTAYLFKPGVNVNIVNPYESFAAENMSPVGTFFIQQDIDNKYAVTNVAFMKRMLGMASDEYGAVEIALYPEANPETVKEAVQKIFNQGY